MKRLFAVLLLLTLGLCGCADNTPATSDADLQIVTDSFAVYDWTKNIIGDVNAELIMLGGNGTDMHSYQPIAHDFILLKDCDLCLYIGGESDKWIGEAMEQTSSSASALPLLTVIDNVKTEQITEGMTADEHNHAVNEPELDEHIWLSLKNAVTCTNAIAERLAEIDPANAEIYRANADSYCDKLTQLDSEYAQTIVNAAFNDILVADRFPFIYLVEDYRLNWCAAYAGCSAETGASFETVMFLSEKLKEMKLPAVLICENSDTTLAKTITDTAGLPDTEIIVINSLQSVTNEEIAAGQTYIKAMQDNLTALSAALN